jgi:hypothetical protein
MHRHSTCHGAVLSNKVGDQRITQPNDAWRTLDDAAQSLRHRRTGRQEVHIDAAWAIMAGCLNGREMLAIACPPDPPAIHFADHLDTFLA